MGVLNISTFGLAVGAFGHFLFYSQVFDNIPLYILMAGLLLPWGVTYFLSFCSTPPPIRPRIFRLILTGAMCWHFLVTVIAEVIHYHSQQQPIGHYSITLARYFMYFGFINFIPFIFYCTLLYEHETEDSIILKKRQTHSESTSKEDTVPPAES